MNLRKYCCARNRDEEAALAASAAPFPIEETTIATLQAAYVSARVTAVSVCHAHLDRIAAFDRKGPALGAIIINNPNALADAAALDATLEATGKLVGPLHGIPVLVKDNFDVAGLQTTAGPGSRCNCDL
jgi:amidase